MHSRFGFSLYGFNFFRFTLRLRQLLIIHSSLTVTRVYRYMLASLSFLFLLLKLIWLMFSCF